VDVRVLAATNQNLERAGAAGEFREDLYYRLNVLQIVVPPLRERREDIPLLIDYFTRRYSKLFQREGFSIPPNVMETLLRRRFPGNVRELENVIKRMVVMGDPHIERDRMFDMAGRGEEGHVEQPKATRVSPKEISRQAAQAAEQAAIVRPLEETRWTVRAPPSCSASDIARCSTRSRRAASIRSGATQA
jgi:two-component system, NtrC family, response regulator AtoC